MTTLQSRTEPAAPPSRRSWWRRPWVFPLMITTVLFLVFAVPPYLRLDPDRARLAPLPDYPLFYPLLVTHIFLGSIVLLAACLQVWPWLRQTHPRIHRWTGRTYVAALIPAAICVIIIAPMTGRGPNAAVANTVLGVLWLVVTVRGFLAARGRRFDEHREWMLRSFALSFSIVANRFWTAVCLAAFAPAVFSNAPVDEATINQAVGVASWASWVVNLLIVEWWLHRRRR